MLSARYIACHIKKFKRNVFFGKYRSRKDFKSIKQNTNHTAKFTLCITKGEFGFFNCVNIFKHCFSVGCRGPPNQFESKNLS